MAAVDFEMAWLDLKAYIAEKPSHGQRDLLRRITEIEVSRRVPEGEEGFDPLPTRPRLVSTRPAEPASV